MLRVEFSFAAELTRKSNGRCRYERILEFADGVPLFDRTVTFFFQTDDPFFWFSRSYNIEIGPYRLL